MTKTTEYYKNIEQALKVERPMDKVVKILNNKFAIVKSAFTDGTFDIPSLCGLDKKIVYFYGHKDKSGKFDSVKRYATKVMEMPNAEKTLVGYNHLPYMVLKTQNNKRYKKDYRKILKLNIF